MFHQRLARPRRRALPVVVVRLVAHKQHRQLPPADQLLKISVCPPRPSALPAATAFFTASAMVSGANVAKMQIRRQPAGSPRLRVIARLLVVLRVRCFTNSSSRLSAACVPPVKLSTGPTLRSSFVKPAVMSSEREKLEGVCVASRRGEARSPRLEQDNSAAPPSGAAESGAAAQSSGRRPAKAPPRRHPLSRKAASAAWPAPLRQRSGSRQGFSSPISSAACTSSRNASSVRRRPPHHKCQLRAQPHPRPHPAVPAARKW